MASKESSRKDEKEFDQDDLAEMLAYFPEGDYLGMLVHVLEKSNLGNRQHGFLHDFIDAVSMKNSSSMLLADSRSKRHPRRGAIGSKLLETLVQLLVLRQKKTAPTRHVRFRLMNWHVLFVNVTGLSSMVVEKSVLPMLMWK